MKKIIFIILLTTGVIPMFIQCQLSIRKDNSSSSYITIAGKTDKPGKSYFIHPDGKPHGLLVRSTFDSLGNFIARFQASPKTITYKFKMGNFITFHAIAGDSIYIDCTKKNIQFSGDRSEENRLLLKINKVIDYSIVHKLNSYDEKYEYLNTKYKEKIEVLRADALCNQKFKDDYALYLKWDFLLSQLPTTDYYSIFKNITNRDNYIPFINSVQLDEKELLQFNNAMTFLDNYFMHLEWVGQLNSDVDDYMIHRLKILSNKTLQETYALHLIRRDMYRNNTFLLNNIALVEQYIETEIGNDSLNSYKHRIEENKLIFNSLAPGKQAPNFTVKDLNGNPVSLLDYRGKTVFIEMWSLGCHPCKQELPYLQDLQKEFENEEIVFINLSFDPEKNLSKLKDYIVKNKLTGIQLYEPKGFKSQMASDYLLSGVPEFIIIDRNGLIVDAFSARPSNPLLKKQLQKVVHLN